MHWGEAMQGPVGLGPTWALPLPSCKNWVNYSNPQSLRVLHRECGQSLPQWALVRIERSLSVKEIRELSRGRVVILLTPSFVLGAQMPAWNGAVGQVRQCNIGTGKAKGTQGTKEAPGDRLVWVCRHSPS